MNIKNMAQKIVTHYWKHSGKRAAPIKVTSCELVNGEERCIYTIKLNPGTQESLIFNRAKDIQTALQLPLFQPFKENLTVRIAVSEKPINENSLRKMLNSSAICRSKMILPIALGYDMRGAMRFVDLVKLIHAMYAGSTGSGKSVGLWSLIASIIYLQPVKKVNLLLFDVGAYALDIFAGIPHLSYSIIKDVNTAVYVLLKLVAELERRMKLSINELVHEPALISIIDEYLSILSNISDKKLAQLIIDCISTILRHGRQAKMFLVVALKTLLLKI
ncbi:MAG: FtsK/SpoIIIE domain-containing protein [Lachnospiraceae bacterium]|nr:FtsK/SpoIIIE domain-containing protein [Lachnospiraceae bacterium]